MNSLACAALLEAHLCGTFKQIDTNNDGVLSADELSAAKAAGEIWARSGEIWAWLGGGASTVASAAAAGEAERVAEAAKAAKAAAKAAADKRKLDQPAHTSKRSRRGAAK